MTRYFLGDLLSKTVKRHLTHQGLARPRRSFSHIALSHHYDRVDNFEPIRGTDDPHEQTADIHVKEFGRLPGHFARHRQNGGIYLVKHGHIGEAKGDGDNFHVRREQFASSYMHVSVNSSPLFQKHIVTPETVIIKTRPDHNAPLLLGSRIIPLMSYPDHATKSIYALSMAEMLNKRQFQPLTACFLPLVIIDSSDHPGPFFANTGKEAHSNRLALFDFDICFGYGTQTGPTADIAAQKSFNISLCTDIDGYREIFRKRLSATGRTMASHNMLHCSSAGENSASSPIFLNHLTFHNIIHAPIPSAEQIATMARHIFTGHQGQIDERSYQLILRVQQRADEARLLKQAAVTMIRGLNSSQLFPSAVTLMEHIQSEGAHLETASPFVRQAMINKMIIDADLQHVAEKFQRESTYASRTLLSGTARRR